jgi:hypothetical protein
LGFTTSYIEGETGHIFNNITNAALLHYPPDFSSPKSAESFCGANLLNEQDFIDSTPAASASIRPMSPLDIFSAKKFKTSPTVLPDSEQIKALIKSEVKQKENCENQQEKQKNRNTNGSSHRNFSRF